MNHQYRYSRPKTTGLTNREHKVTFRHLPDGLESHANKLNMCKKAHDNANGSRRSAKTSVMSDLPPVAVKTGSSRSGTDERGKCDNVGLSAACPSNEATIRSVVVAVA